MSADLQYGTTRFDQLQELKRELQMRRQLYPKWWKTGRLDKATAEHRLNCLQAVVDDFERRYSPQSQQGSLGL